MAALPKLRDYLKLYSTTDISKVYKLLLLYFIIVQCQSFSTASA